MKQSWHWWGVALVGAMALAVMSQQDTSARPASRSQNATPCGMTRVGMVCVPAGRFRIGSYSGDVDEDPPHMVFVDAFLVDKYEVTFKQYNRCVTAGRCRKPHYIMLGKAPVGRIRERTTKKVRVKIDPKFPVVGVSWKDADTYCRALGKRLPTEAEWEKAARGTDGRRYAWGNSPPDCKKANIDVCGRKIQQVGKHPTGASPYGAQDLTGNVWEWVSDWYDPQFYRRPEAARNPAGPANPTDPVTGRSVYRYKILRGGGYTGSPSPLWASYRFRLLPNTRGDDIGFRCVLSKHTPVMAPTTTMVQPTRTGAAADFESISGQGGAAGTTTGTAGTTTGEAKNPLLAPGSTARPHSTARPRSGARPGAQPQPANPR